MIVGYSPGQTKGSLFFQFNASSIKKYTNNFKLNLNKGNIRTLATFLGLKGYKEIWVPGYVVRQMGVDTNGTAKAESVCNATVLKQCFKEDEIAVFSAKPWWIQYAVFSATEFVPQNTAQPQCVAPFLMGATNTPDLKQFMKVKGKADVLHPTTHNSTTDPECLKESNHGNSYYAPRFIAPEYDACNNGQYNKKASDADVFTP